MCVWIVAGSVAFAQEGNPPPDIVVTPTSLSFGGACVGATISRSVTIKNNDSNPNNDLEVTDISRTQGTSNFSVSDPSPVTIPPQEQRVVSFSFKPALPAGGKTATFEISSNGDEQTVSVAASGTVLHRLIAVGSGTVSFGEQRVGTRSPSRKLIVRNPGQDAISVTSIKRVGVNPGDFVVGAPAQPFTIAAGDFKEVPIAFQPTADGLRRATLEITSNSCTQPKLNVALVGTGVLPNVNVQPNPIDVGMSPVGTKSKPTSITVSNDGAAELTITTIQIVGTDAADFALSGLPVTPKKLQPDESFVFSISMTPTAEGLRLANLNVLSDDADAPSFTVAVRGEATAASPSPSASASASPSASPSPSPTRTASASAPRNPNDSLAIVLVVGGVIFAFVGLIVVRRFVRAPDDLED